MLRPHGDYPQFRPGVAAPGAPTPINGPAGGGMIGLPTNAPINMPMNMAPSPYPPAPFGSRSFVRPPVSGGHFAYPPPPPTPVPAPHLGPFLHPVQAFVPPLPPTPPIEAPPPPPPPPPSIASPLDGLSPPNSIPGELSSVEEVPCRLPAEPSKPRDAEVLKKIEGMAEFVVKNGPRYESMARAKHAGDPNFAFLFENDSGPEAVINRDYYKWKKEILQLQSEAAAELKSSKLLESVSISSRNKGQSLKAPREDDVPGSPSMSDMDMEEDLDAPFPRSDSTKLSLLASGEESDSLEKASALNQSARSDSSANEAEDAAEKGSNSNQGKQAQCRLTGDYTGSLIDNYMSDTSEDSEDLEPSTNLNIAESTETTAQVSKEESKSPRQECVEPTPDLVNASSSEATEYLNSCEGDEQKVAEPQDGEDKGEGQVDVSYVQSEKEPFQAALDEIVSQEIREKSRSPSRTGRKSPLRSDNESPIKTKTKSRSASPSNEAKCISPSPSSSALQNTPGRLLPNNLPSKDADQAVIEFTARPKREVKRRTNICVNYARGRCFRGDSCRLQHQGSEKFLQGGDKVLEPEQNGSSKLTDATLNGEKAVALDIHEDADLSVDIMATRKGKRKAASGKVEENSQLEVAKRPEFRRETADMPGGASQEDFAKEQDLSMQENAGPPSSVPERAAATDAALKGELLHVKASQAAEVLARSPVPPLAETGMHITGDYGSSRFLNHDTLQFSGFPGVSPSMRPSVLPPVSITYTSTNTEADRLHAKSYSGVSAQFSTAGLQHPPYRNLGVIHSAASSENPTYEYADLTRNFATSYSKEYGLPLQTQSGTAQNTLVPRPVYPPITQQRDFSMDTSRGYSSLQHGYTSPFSMRAPSQESLRPPPFSGDPSRQSVFSDVANREPLSAYPKSSFTYSSQSHGYTPWANSGSSVFSSSKVTEVPSGSGKSSSYSYSLTTIPPPPSIIELPGVSKASNPSDQYDPLSDSLEPSTIVGSKSNSFSLLKTVEDIKPFGTFGKTPAPQLENVSPAFDAAKFDPAEIAGDPVVGIVENVSPPEDNRLWSPGPLAEGTDAKQDQLSSKNKKSNARGLKLLRSAVADHVKEVLKPTWKEGRMSKDAFKNIVKKAVDKVTAALPPHHIPKSQEKVDQFMLSSRTKIAKLVQGYIDKYQKN